MDSHTTFAAPTVSVADIEIAASDLGNPAGIERAAAIFRAQGCLVVRGLFTPYLSTVRAEVEEVAQTAISLLPQATRSELGWHTPDGTLFLPAPPNFEREQQLMTLPYSYRTSATFLQSALDAAKLDFVEAILGPDIELSDYGQCLYKEPVGGHPKHLHQDSAYFEHRFQGPVAFLNYVVDTDLVNGALHVVPGSHLKGQLRHIDTFSHLGLDEDEWPWEAALPIKGAAGDAIVFHVKTIHGSKENFGTQARPVVIHRYRAADDYVTVGAATAKDRAEAEKSAATARKENQQGLMVRGVRRFDAGRFA